MQSWAARFKRFAIEVARVRDFLDLRGQNAYHDVSTQGARGGQGMALNQRLHTFEAIVLFFRARLRNIPLAVFVVHDTGRFLWQERIQAADAAIKPHGVNSFIFTSTIHLSFSTTRRHTLEAHPRQNRKKVPTHWKKKRDAEKSKRAAKQDVKMPRQRKLSRREASASVQRRMRHRGEAREETIRETQAIELRGKKTIS